MKKSIKPWLILWICVLAVLFAFYVLQELGHRLVYPEISQTLIACFLLVSAVLSVQVINKWIIRWNKLLKAVSTGFFAVVLAAFLLFVLLTNSISGRPYRMFTSPSGANRVVVFEGAIVDAVYSAYALENPLFYRDNGEKALTRKDFIGGADVQAEWLDENTAKVYVIFDPAQGRAESDAIIVKFDS